MVGLDAGAQLISIPFCPLFNVVYTCHDSWQDKGTHYMIVSQPESEPGVVKTFCFTMRWEDPPSKSPGGRASRLEHQEQELWLSRPAREFQTEANDQWTYRLASQGKKIPPELLVMHEKPPTRVGIH